MMFEQRNNKKMVSLDSAKSESINSTYGNNEKNRVIEFSLIGYKDILSAKIPLPPPPLNIKKLLLDKKKWSDWDELVEIQSKHIQNLHEIWAFYYTHIQKLNDYIKKEQFNKLSHKFDNKSESTPNLHIKHKANQINEKCTVNSETVMAFGETNSTNPHYKSSDEFLQKFESAKDENSQKSNDLSKPKLNIPNNSDFTDLSSTKSGKRVAQPKEINPKVLKIKAEFGSNIQERTNIKWINMKKSVKSPSFQRSESNWEGRFTDHNKLASIITDTGYQLDSHSIEKAEKGSKEVNINSIHNISISESNELFTNELSCIKNGPCTIKKKDNSEIYDQWLNESKLIFSLFISL